MQMQDTIKTLNRASSIKKPSSDARIAIPQMDDNLMTGKINGLGLADMSIGIDIYPAFKDIPLLGSKAVIKSLKIIIHLVIVIKIQMWIETKSNQSG